MTDVTSTHKLLARTSHMVPKYTQISGAVCSVASTNSLSHRSLAPWLGKFGELTDIKTPATEQAIAKCSFLFPQKASVLSGRALVLMREVVSICAVFTVGDSCLPAAQMGQLLGMWLLGQFGPGWGKLCRENHVIPPNSSPESEIIIIIRHPAAQPFNQSHRQSLSRISLSFALAAKGQKQSDLELLFSIFWQSLLCVAVTEYWLVEESTRHVVKIKTTD